MKVTNAINCNMDLDCGCSCHTDNEFNAICFSCNCDSRVDKAKVKCLLPELLAWESSLNEGKEHAYKTPETELLADALPVGLKPKGRYSVQCDKPKQRRYADVKGAVSIENFI